MADDFQSGICSGSWWNPARSFEMVEVKARSGDDPAGSASGSSITFQDTHKVIPQDQMMGGQLMDSSLQIPTFGLSATTMDWTQALLSSGRAETNYQAMLQEDLSSRPFLRQDQSVNQSLLLSQPHLSSGNIDNFVSAPAPMMDYRENLNELPQDSWQKFPQFLNASTPKQQPTTNQLQFANNTPFWNPWAATACEIRSGFYPQATTQFGAQTFEQKPSSRSLTPKSNSEGAREQTKKSNSSEPALKKPRIETPSPLPTFKVRKEKLGDRITALQQLVSPFGKTDTASVLHEAIEYIKFLHDQVSVLSTPYLKNGHPMQHQENSDKSMDGEGTKQDLRSRGLCLVPVASTYQVASEPQADFWTPTFGGTYR